MDQTEIGPDIRMSDDIKKPRRRQGDPMPPVIRAKLGPRPRGNAPATAAAAAPGAAVVTAKPAASPPRVVPSPAGLTAREIAIDLVAAVLEKKRAFDDALGEAFASAKGLALAPRDRGLARLIAATVLRRKGGLEALLAEFMERPLGDKQSGVQRILLTASAQMLYLDTPAHAAINLAVAECRRNPATARYDKLVNAVLRRVSLEGAKRLADIDTVRLAIPDWMWANWAAAYGEDEARRIAEASLSEAPLDLSIRNPDDAGKWAASLSGSLLTTGAVRLAAGGRIEDREGFGDGAWWVQDAAAQLPAALFGAELKGKRVADLCAAPGGKTAQLAARGGDVTAVDVSQARLDRVAENLKRLGLAAHLVAADAAKWQPKEQFDAVLLDAPCTATGTIRRHPDILHLKRPGDVAKLAQLQRPLLDAAAALVAPGGTLVFCTCSLEKPEGSNLVESFLARHPEFTRRPITAGEAGIESNWLTRHGDLRTLPCHTPAGAEPGSGMDGFYAARMVRQATESSE